MNKDDIGKDEAVEALRRLVGRDLRALAAKYGVTVFKTGAGFNKGWAGHVLERYLGLPLNSAQRPDLGDWELKVIPLALTGKGHLRVKETMAITMINATQVVATPFRDSHLYQKLCRVILCARIRVDRLETSSPLVRVEDIDLNDPLHAASLATIAMDYELVRQTIREHGFDALSGNMGVLVQPRTKGPGYGSRSRAFYARASTLALLLKLE